MGCGVVSSRLLRLSAAALAVAITACVLPAGLADAADGGTSASSRVTRDGRIITSIINRTPIRYTGRGTAPVTYWLTLSDAELRFMMALVAAQPEVEDTFVAVLDAMANADAGVMSDVQIRITRGRFDGSVRLVPIDPGAPAQVLARSMVTVLPALTTTVSPPRGTAVVVGEPAFTSFDAATWATAVDRTLTVGAVTARVRAHPVRFTVRSGDPDDARTTTCDGPGRPFDPDDPASPRRQARRTGGCTVTYRTVTGTGDRRDRWYGDVTVVWRAEWSTDGLIWRSLGEVPQISVFSRQVVEATTALESD